ncbi:MAG TPA: KTSC domain-containing protein [Solirubrobacteraceae bacterium]|nr:KTSC domain-containing protein [Solirubrobacteraceae bacterium]
MLPIGWMPGQSSAIEAYRYDTPAAVLHIAYVRGRRVYDFPCPPDMFAAFERAPSRGQYVERVLRPYAQQQGWSRPSYAWPW